MPRYRSADHQLVRSTKWEPERPAERVSDHILMSRCTSNSYLVTSDDGDVVINTGTLYQGARTRERYEQELGRALDVRTIVFTQSHPDHMGGWSEFAGPGVETIAQAYYPEGRLDRLRLRDFFSRRSAVVVGGLQGRERQRSYHFETREAEVDTLFDDSHAFEVGGRRFELSSIAGGETRDGVCVWLPAERTAFIGNLDGALWGQLPHLYTPRGDRPRSAREFIRSVQRVLDLEPELLLTGHDEPIAGAERIRRELGKVRDATEYVHDRTVEGMNEGKDLWTLMAEIRLPEHLEPAPGRGPVRWYVRAVWEEYTGWFRFESTTELYPVPPRAVWPELTELAGGPDVLAERAAAHVAAGRPLEAIHLTDIALSVDPSHRAAREAEIAALEELVERTEGKSYDELTWLESRLDAAHAALGDTVTA
jgi:alkyl sulfatase BDS1-like metallo-beta-lactamase superfamily hydrolase